jgi:2-polyprenyl-6-methoxyphenol hydroxylase-like FAD-dependent oxidoreductase
MRITIVGAGPAGLALARILHVHGIETSVYERDPAPHARPQGGTLDLHPESGQYALEAAGDPVVTRDMRVTPPEMSWPSHPSLTLIGDAAHLMPPVGEGANQALRDAADLAAEVVANPDDPAGAIARYEMQMRARIAPIERESAKMQQLILSPTALDDMVRFFTPAADRR